MGTTKLTRKEILAEDQAHKAIISLFEFLTEYRKAIIILCIVLILIALGGYFGLGYLDNKEMQAQEVLGRGMDFYHAKVDPEAAEDPYAEGLVPVFRSEELKYEAAAREFSSVEGVLDSSKVSLIAQYYLGLTQLKLGKNEEAAENLETVAKNSKGRTVGYLAKNVLVRHYVSTGNNIEAKKLLESMIADSKYNLPKEDLSIRLSRILIAEGNNEEAVRVLQEADSQGSTFSSFRQKLTAELDKVQKATKTEPES